MSFNLTTTITLKYPGPTYYQPPVGLYLHMMTSAYSGGNLGLALIQSYAQGAYALNILTNEPTNRIDYGRNSDTATITGASTYDIKSYIIWRSYTPATISLYKLNF